MRARIITVALLALLCFSDGAGPVAIALNLPSRVPGAGASSLAAAGQRRALLSWARALLLGQCTPPAPCARLQAGFHDLSAALFGRRVSVQHIAEGSRSSASGLRSATSSAQEHRLVGDAGGGPTDAVRRRTARDILLIMAGGALPDPALVRRLVSLVPGTCRLAGSWKAHINQDQGL